MIYVFGNIVEVFGFFEIIFYVEDDLEGGFVFGYVFLIGYM